MGRIPTRSLTLVALALVAVAAAWGPAPGAGAGTEGSGADTGGAAAPGPVVVVNASGLLDPVLVNFLEVSLADAEAAGASAFVIQLNSEGAVVSDERLTRLARRLVDAEVPLAVWVGTSGAQARGAAAELVGIADHTGMAPGTRLGAVGRQRLPADEFGVLFGDGADAVRDATVDDETAYELGLVTRFPPIVVEADGREVEILGAPTVGDFIVNLPGVPTTEIEVDGQPRRQPAVTVLFNRLSVPDQMAHTVASPEVAYLLLALGLGLLVFELYTAGIGIAGAVGAGCLVAGCYGLWVLPTNWWAVALIGLAFFGFAVDVQTGVPRAWTVIGVVAFVVGTFGLYDGLTMSWITIAVGVVGVLLAYYAGMPAMVRTRFSTPTIGREWMIGELGEAVADVAPSGVVKVRDALWRAETNRATPIAAGERIRVVGIDRLLLEVEPEAGGARDYREPRRRTGEK